MDAILELLEKYKIPVTRDNYLGFAFAGTDVDTENLSAEQEAMLPEQFQKDVSPKQGLLA
mgnify:CR=1 FL=1